MPYASAEDVAAVVELTSCQESTARDYFNEAASELQPNADRAAICNRAADMIYDARSAEDEVKRKNAERSLRRRGPPAA